MRRTKSGKTFARRIFGVVNQLLHPGLPVMIVSASGILDQPCDFLRKLSQQRVQLVVLLFGSKIRQHERETSASFPFFKEKQPPRVRAVIGFKKPVPLRQREMADLDNG